MCGRGAPGSSMSLCTLERGRALPPPRALRLHAWGAFAASGLTPRAAWGGSDLGDQIAIRVPGCVTKERRHEHHADEQRDEADRGHCHDEAAPYEHRGE